MKLIATFLIAIIAFSFDSNANTQQMNLFPRCGGVFDLCGYVDLVTENEIIPKRFERAMPFSEGIAAVRIKGRFGYINVKGNVVIAPKYDLAGPFYQDIAEVMVNGHTGVIDRKGKWLLKPRFARSIPFTKEVVIVKSGAWQSGYYQGYERLEGLESLMGSDPFGLYHLRTGWIAHPKYIFSVFERHGMGMIWAKEINQDENLFGLLGADGAWRVSPQYSYGQELYEGYAIITKKVDKKHNSTELWGAVNHEGKLVIPIIYDLLSYWNNGYGIAHKDGKEGLLDSSGNLLGGRFFDKVQRPEEDISARVQINGTWHAISANGALSKIIEQQQDLYTASTEEPTFEPQDILHCSGGITRFCCYFLFNPLQCCCKMKKSRESAF
jgi:WG containing repeat